MDTISENFITKKARAKSYCKLYWRNIFIILTPIILMPIAFIEEDNDNKAYKCFYVFVITVILWVTNVIPANITAFVPVALTTVIKIVDQSLTTQVYLDTNLHNSFGVMMIIIAIEHSQVHKRIALKLLLAFGCSHYTLSLLLFFTSMFMSMWISSIVSCGLMIPIVKSVLEELEKMGLIDVSQTDERAAQKENKGFKPSRFTLFYFLGISYSATIGGVATLSGGQSNQIFKMYCEIIFPSGPKIDFPQYMLLNLPGVILIETLLYVWMNFFFLGMFRLQNDIPIQPGLTNEEMQYMFSLLNTRYTQLGKIKTHELIVVVVIILTALLQGISNTSDIFDHQRETLSVPYIHTRKSAATIIGVLVLFLVPTDVNFLRFITEKNADLLPKNSSPSCLNWNLVKANMHWRVLIIIGSSSALFESLRQSGMTSQFEKFLLLFSGLPALMLVLVVMLFCKVLGELAPSGTVVYCLLPHIARLAVLSRVNPHYLMLAASLSSSLPFHMVTGSPSNALVAAYMHVPHWKMMSAGIGPSIIALVISWFTATIWSKTIWTDVNTFPSWALDNTLSI